jgi:hypothetical protein
MCEDENYVGTMMKLFRQFKLGNTLHICKYRVDNELAKNNNLGERAIDELARTEIAHVLAEQIVNQHRSEIKTSSVDGGKITEYGVQIMVLGLNDFKTVVEAAIQMLPEEQIKKIRNGQS